MAHSSSPDHPSSLPSRRWLLFAFLLIVVWTLALTVSQHFSIPAEGNVRGMEPLGRFVLSFFLLSSIVLLFPRSVVLAALIASLFFQWGTLYYHSYIGSAPEIMVLLNNVTDAAEVGDAVWTLIPWHYLLFLVPVLLLQVFLLYRHTPPPALYRWRIKTALCCMVAYGALLGAFFARTGQSPSMEARCARFGFLPTFTQDVVFRFTQLEKLKEQALANEAKRSFGLQSEYQEFAFKNIVVLQVETLDNAVMDYQVNGKTVVPFLNALRESSLSYRMMARKRYCSAGADFEMLNGIPPLDGFFNYRVPDLSYNTSLPRFFSEQGYETFCFHGVRGSMFNRRTAFTAMQFDHLIFREEIVEAVRDGKYSLHGEFPEEQHAEHMNAAWLRDDVVLSTVLQEIHSPSERDRFFFVITATSHAPFPTKHISNADKLIPNERSQQDRFLNSIHIVDRWLRSFHENLPPGTLLILYGDHSAKFQSGAFLSDFEGQHEFVPCLIHVVGENLAQFQKIPHRSEENALSARDVHSYIRDITERNAAESWREAQTDTTNVY